MTFMRNKFVGAAILALVASVGCKDERAITTKPVGDVAYGQNLIKAASNLPRGRVGLPNNRVASATPANDSIWIDFAGLDSLETASYVIWVGNDSATKFVKLSGYNLTVSIIDTTINAAGDPVFTPRVVTIPNVTSFKNGGPNRTFRMSMLRPNIAGLAATDSINVVLFTMETTVGDTPGDKRFMWTRRSEATLTSNTATPPVLLTTIAPLVFGNFDKRRTEQYLYDSSTVAAVPTATMPAIPRGRIEVRGNVFTVNDSNYSRPPKGYYYQAWAVRVDTLGVPKDTVSLGVKASPYPNRTSFFDADMTIPDPQYMYVLATPCVPGAVACRVQQPAIFASQHRVTADTVADATVLGKPWKGFAWTYVTLQNKAAALNKMGVAHIMSVNLPGSISGY